MKQGIDGAETALWQFEATQNRFLYSLILFQYFWLVTMLQKMKKKCSFVGALFLWGPCSAERVEHA